MATYLDILRKQIGPEIDDRSIPIPTGLTDRQFADWVYQNRGDLGRWGDSADGGSVKAAGYLGAPGMQMYLPDSQTWRDYGFGGGSPDPKLDLQQFMAKNNIGSLAEYQQMYGGLPLQFDSNDPNYATFDPAARVNKFSYEPKDSLFVKALPAAWMALAGAGLTGMLPGTTPAFGGAGLGAGVEGGTLAGGVPDSYWNMVAQGGGTASDISAGLGAFGADAAMPATFGEFANPVLTEGLAGAAGTNMVPWAASPSVGGYGALEGLLGSAAGGSGGGLSIPGIQDILQGGGAAASAAGPNILQQLLKGLGTPVGSAIGIGGDNSTQGQGPSIGQLLGTGLGTYFGYESAKDSANQVQDVYRQAQEMAQADMSNRQPFVNQATSWLQNPSSFWGGDVGQEIARQTARSIGGARQENLFDNPTGQSLVMQSLAPQWLNAVNMMANQGLRNTAPLSELSGIGLQSANAQGRPAAVLGGGFTDLLGNPGANSVNNVNEQLRRMLQSFGGDTTRLP